MDPSTALIYTFQDPLVTENISLYKPTSEYFDLVRGIIPTDWTVRQEGFWTRCFPSGWAGPPHGWKIHVSSVLSHAEETLRIVARKLGKLGVAFKFSSDPRMLKISLGKTWSRFQVGKFIAVYPVDESQFKVTIDALYEATRHLVGPHVLTDRPYRDSRTVYYRYGAFTQERRVDPWGHHAAGYTLNDGHWYDDARNSQFRLPPGVNDPFAQDLPTEASRAPEGEIVLAGRYLIQGVIKFSAMGGIYLGVDKQTAKPVVLREVRGTLGHLESEMPDDPAFVLKREARILQRLATTGVVPAFVDLFKEWTNWFLVEERLDATSLWHHSMDIFFSDETQSTNVSVDKVFSTIRAIAEGLHAVHERGVVLRDMTKSNVMFARDGSVRFVDFEFAYELDDASPWVKGFTPGYASREQIAQERPAPADDYYALGALILDMVTFCSAGLDLNREGVLRRLKLNLADLSLPPLLYDMVVHLMDPDPGQRWRASDVLATLDDMSGQSEQMTMFPPRERLLDATAPAPELFERIRSILHRMGEYLDRTADYSRDDRLWPSSVETFITNPVSVQFGAAGVAAFLLRSRGNVPDRVLDWIERKTAEASRPPGLYIGTCGVALTLLQAGRRNAAERMLAGVSGDPLLKALPGLYFGYAGWGWTLLHFWRQTGEAAYLHRAAMVGEDLLRFAQHTPQGVYWPAGGKVYLGLGEGQSGVALFLTCLAAATDDARFSAAAAQAIDFDMAHASRFGGRLLWKTHVGAKASEPNLPHTRFGTSGIGSACIRLYAFTGEERYMQWALDCAYTVRPRVTNKIWQDDGSAGFGEFMLDMASLLDEPRFIDLACYHAESIAIHAIEFSEGTTFAGVDHFRICSDFGHGAAGIGVFFDRLLHRKPRFLMLDDLLVGRPSAAHGESEFQACRLTT